MAISTDDIRRLVAQDLRGPVLSVLLRTDPRDAANTRHAPRWQVALRTALQDITAWVEEHAAREERLALRGLQLEAQRELAGLPAEQRGRGIAWFVSPDRQLDRRFTLQLPPSRDSVRWDARPFVSPLVELVDRGRPVAIVLIALDSVRLLTWEGGRVTEPVRSVYDLELGDWRDYTGYAAANPARGQQTATHVESYEHRVEAWRKRFYKETGIALADRLRDLGLSRIVLAAESGLADEFAELLPGHLAREVIGEPATNLMQEEPADIGERLEPSIHQAWLSSARAALEKTVNAAHAGLPAVLGPDETLQALEARRVNLLTLDPDFPFSVAQLGPAAVASLRTPRDDMVAECAVELALAAGAQVGDVAPVLSRSGCGASSRRVSRRVRRGVERLEAAATGVRHRSYTPEETTSPCASASRLGSGLILARPFSWHRAERRISTTKEGPGSGGTQHLAFPGDSHDAREVDRVRPGRRPRRVSERLLV